MSDRAPTDRDETEYERFDRNLTELLQELRVALPGVQVLFGFLLIVPFNQRFGRLSDFEQKTYFATLLCTALASILLIAPSAHHRIAFRQRDKGHVVMVANRLAIAGLAVLALAMTGVILLITHLLFGAVATYATTASVAVTFATIWYALPLRRRWRRIRHLRRSGARHSP